MSDQPTGAHPAEKSWVKQRGPGFFLFVSFFYLVILVLLMLAREFQWLNLERLPARMADIIPLAIPWFGALGAVLISLYGVFDHNGAGKWDSTYDYWHLLRPFVGAVLGTVAYLIFVGFVNASTTDETATIPKDAQHAIPYLVIAFVVGFREDTFRTLIKRVVDTILGPGIPGVTPPVGVSVSPSPVRFDETAVGSTAEPIDVTVTNSGSGNLVIHGSADTPKGVELSGEAFSVERDSVTGAVILSGAQATLTIGFHPTEAKEYEGTLTIHSNAGTQTVDLSGRGTEPGGG